MLNTPLGRRERDRGESVTLTIEVGAAVGTGATEAAAFDAALCELGVGEANLIRLSSVIPPRSRVRRTPRIGMRIDWGERLYCVYALGRSNTAGASAAAGIGWTLCADGSGAGLFVEHAGETTAQVEDLVHASLADMTAVRPHSFGPIHITTAQTHYTDRPTCALALAAYRTAGWDEPV